MRKDIDQHQRDGLLKLRSSQYGPPGDKAFALLEAFRELVQTSIPIPQTSQYRSLVATVLEIVQRVGVLLQMEFWERTKSAPGRKTMMPKVQSIRERRAMFRLHQRRLQGDSVTLAARGGSDLLTPRGAK